MFPNFSERLERELKGIVDKRLAIHSNHQAVNKNEEGVKVNVRAHEHQRYAVWSGGSLLGSLPDFPNHCVQKAEYDEKGPGCCRQSKVFSFY